MVTPFTQSNWILDLAMSTPFQLRVNSPSFVVVAAVNSTIGCGEVETVKEALFAPASWSLPPLFLGYMVTETFLEVPLTFLILKEAVPEVLVKPESIDCRMLQGKDVPS